MPNHIINRVELRGEEAKIKEVMDFIGEEMDFDKIIPMPKEVKASLDSNSKDDLWYHWAVKNWGTKWNAYDHRKGDIDPYHYIFLTAWTMPEPVIKELSARFPEIEVFILWADEDMGFNCGSRTYKGGKVNYEWCPEGGSPDAFDLAEEAWNEC